MQFAHGGCRNTARESALKGDSGRKFPCRTGDSNPRQCCAVLCDVCVFYFWRSTNFAIPAPGGVGKRGGGGGGSGQVVSADSMGLTRCSSLVQPCWR